MHESPPTEIVVTYEGRTFPFQLHHRELDFGASKKSDYYWMDGRQLRQGAGGPNFRSCVDLWWHAVEQAGEADLPDNEATLTLAECYPLINTSKGMQDVYLDAHLHPQADREYVRDDRSASGSPFTERTYSLPDDERARLKAIAHTRDLSRLRQELDRVFLGWIPTPDILPAYQEAAQAWIGNGIVALRNGGRAALSDYTKTIDEWIQKYRRRGGQQHVRHFVNIFSYECKVAFYLCYTSAWVAILDHLVQNHLTDVTGMRLMSMWHNQNRTDVDEQGRPNDVFRGQVLALHPLSGIVQTSSDHLSVLGKWLNHPDYDELVATGRVGECPEYWDVVATILIAAHEYRASHKQWDLTRGKKAVTSTNALAGKARNDSTASTAVLFEDFADKRGITCSSCSAPPRFDYFEPEPGQPATVTAYFNCPKCENSLSVQVSYDDLQKTLEEDD